MRICQHKLCGREIDTSKHRHAQYCNRQCKERARDYRRYHGVKATDVNTTQTLTKWHVKSLTLMSTHHITAHQWMDMYLNQHGQCALCTHPLAYMNRQDIHTDHDHKCCDDSGSCGQCIRGILCKRCNNLMIKFDALLECEKEMIMSIHAIEYQQNRVTFE